MYRISRANKRHLKDISRLIVDTRIGKETLAEQVAEGLAQHTWFVRMDGRIVGCMGAEFIDRRTAILTHLAVSAEYRKRGIGMALFRHAVEFARRRGAHTVAFITMYYHFRRFKKHGFAVFKRCDLPEAIKAHWMFTAKRYMKCAAMLRRI